MTINQSLTAVASVAQEIRITEVEPFLLHVPVTGAHIADSMHRVTHWGVCGVVLHTDSGLRGYGYTGTHAHRECDQLITRLHQPGLFAACYAANQFTMCRGCGKSSIAFLQPSGSAAPASRNLRWPRWISRSGT